MQKRLTIRGLVQGVGFRPFIYRLANDIGIRGTVSNTNNGVVIVFIGTEYKYHDFIRRIYKESPQVSYIHEIITEDTSDETEYAGFSIIPGNSSSVEVTQVAPDIAVCDDCLYDRKVQSHRLQYPFINCTNCGPRFTIIQDLPYDRGNTTMSSFYMCQQCIREYTDMTDRRFHAQPVACNNCGPVYYAVYKGQEYRDYNQVLQLSALLINEGKTIAVRGMGGYHLICDAQNEKAVSGLRQIKLRDNKPFAVMMLSVDSVMSYASLNDMEEGYISSWRRPIVLLEQIKDLAPSVNPGMKTIGCMLPYMPVHYDLFDRIDSDVLVMTSCNVNDLPIVITPGEAERRFADKVDLIIHHNRPIYNRADDSVLQVCSNKVSIIRRSRGYVPEPFFVDTEVEGLMAFGAEKVNTFALGKEDTIIQSQYIGDLKNWETFGFYKESITRFRRLFRFTPRHLICDLHPDYLSTQYAQQLSSELDLPITYIQHHHAHAASCMLEYGLHDPVVAVVWDGTGFGDDGKIWGGEFFLCDRKQYKRLSHLEYIPMPGGDKASEEPWRMAVAYLHHYHLPFPEKFLERIGKNNIAIVEKMIDKGINTPFTSGAGRFFDAVASLIGVCDVSARQGEAPVLLEQSAGKDYYSFYPIMIYDDPISLKPILEGIVKDINKEVDIELISAKLHNSLAYLIFEKVNLLCVSTGTNKVILSGGCFQNKRLVERLSKLFLYADIPVFVPSYIPGNDGGIAAGQIAIVAARENLN